MALDNSIETLISGTVLLLRDEIGSEFETNDEYNVPNIWGKNVPDSAEQEFPRGTVDVISADDFELSFDLNIRLREATVKIAVFSESDAAVHSIIEDIESTIESKWDQNDPDGDPYIGDWSFRETDGTTPVNESGETEGDLRYSRSIDIIFETVRTN
jgi:hypothetical protein